MLTGIPTGKISLGRSKRRWEDNIRMGLEVIYINAGNWVDSAQDRDYWRALANAAPPGSISHGFSYSVRIYLQILFNIEYVTRFYMIMLMYYVTLDTGFWSQYM